MELAHGANKSINGVLSGPAGMHLMPYFVKLTARL